MSASRHAVIDENRSRTFTMMEQVSMRVLRVEATIRATASSQCLRFADSDQGHECPKLRALGER
jgi:hypothetical protein